MTCRNILDRLQNNPPLDGYLSIEHGFLPPVLPLNQLSEPYSIWDQYVALIPELYFSNRTQEILSQMPLLSVKALADQELPRAAIVLSLLAHAYWRHGSERAFSVRMSDIDGQLPNSILLPWQAVNERLGRGERPFQSFYDMFLNNFALRSAPNAQGAYAHDDVTIENLELLIPCFDNQAERVFCMSFVEMHAIASPLISTIVTIEEAITHNNAQSPAQIIKALAIIEEILKQCLKALRKISPVKGSKNYCDPILWAKTIATFGVPAPNYVAGGTSGAFAPLVVILDALLNREKYGSEYGQYVMKERERLLPAHIVDFVKATAHIDLVGFIKGYASAPDIYEPLAGAYNKVVAVYAGSEGFLGKHISKVFNYLGVATMVGRNQSTSGDERFAHQQTWVKVSKALDIARLERVDMKTENLELEAMPTTLAMPEGLPIYGRLDLAQHHRPNDYWVVIDGYVYNLTDYLKIHPGGKEIMLAYAGQDVSAFFHTIPEHTRPKMVKLLRRYLVGKYQDEASNDADYAAWNRLLETLIFIRALVGMQYDHDAEKRLGILFAGQTHTHFVQEHLATIMSAIPTSEGQVDLMGLAAWHHLKHIEFVTNQDLRMEFPAEKLAHLQKIAHWFAQEDLQLLASLIEFVLKVMAESRYGESAQAAACADLVGQWLDNHLATIGHIARHVEGLFQQTMSQPSVSTKAESAAVPGFSCPMANREAMVEIG